LLEIKPATRKERISVMKMRSKATE